jgi:hypothetical protein
MKMALSTIQFGPWTIRGDKTATECCYQKMEGDSAERCTCDPCKNFDLVQKYAFPTEVLTLLHELGINCQKPFELSHYSRVPSGLHLYGGWFYFLGSIERGPTRSVERITPTFEIQLSQVEKARAPFEESPCVQLDFYMEVPWRSNAPEPE